MNFDEQICKAAHAALTERINAIAEDEIKGVTERIRRRVMDAAGEIAVTVARHVNAMEDSNTIVVKVDTDNLKRLLSPNPR